MELCTGTPNAGERVLSRQQQLPLLVAVAPMPTHSDIPSVGALATPTRNRPQLPPYLGRHMNLRPSAKGGNFGLCSVRASQVVLCEMSVAECDIPTTAKRRAKSLTEGLAPCMLVLRRWRGMDGTSRGTKVPLAMYHGVPPGWRSHEVVEQHAQLHPVHELIVPDVTEPGSPPWLPDRKEWLQYRAALYEVVRGVATG